MQIKKLISSLAFGVMAVFTTANAQELMPETLPTRPIAERIVHAIPPVPTFMEQLKEAEKFSVAAAKSNFGESVVKTALEYLGARYSYGSNGPTVFDCSGFTSYIFRQKNISMLRSSRSQFTQGTPVASISDLKKGDLVFFGGRRNRHSVGHVGIVTEVDESGKNFSFVHASNTGVRISDSSENYYSRRYIGARRIVEN